MRSIRLATTMLHSLRPVGTGAERDHGLLTDVLRREFGSEAATLLAEPVAAQDGSKIDWYVSTDERPVPSTDLSEAERASLLHKLENRRSAIAGLADALERGSQTDRDAARALRHAMVIPGPDAIYLVKGDPVLVAWGYREAGRPNYESGLKAAAGGKMPAAHSLPPMAATMPMPATGILPTTSASGWRWPSLTAFLWLLLAFLVFVFVWLLLTAFPSWRLPFMPAFPGFGTVSLTAPSIAVNPARLDALRLEVATLETRTTDARSACLADAGRPSAPASPEAVTQRIDRSGAQGGALQLSLTWDGPADLDLSAFCPNGGRIDFGHPALCGGRLDVDANAGVPTRSPVENIFWADGAAIPAEVPIGVTYYGDHGDPRAEVPYRLRIRRSVTDPATGEVTASDEFVDGVARRAEIGRTQIPRRIETTSAVEAQR